jgi:hypothetical protein
LLGGAYVELHEGPPKPEATKLVVAVLDDCCPGLEDALILDNSSADELEEEYSKLLFDVKDVIMNALDMTSELAGFIMSEDVVLDSIKPAAADVVDSKSIKVVVTPADGNTVDKENVSESCVVAMVTTNLAVDSASTLDIGAEDGGL